MRQTPIITDFTAGELSPKLSGRFDLAAYAKGCSKLENFVPFSQGGITYRPGTKYLGRTRGDKSARLIPFILSSDVVYLLEIVPGFLRIWQNGVLLEGEIGVPYATIGEIREIQFAQIYNVLYFAHRSYPPRKLIWNGSGSFSFSSLAITSNAGKLPFQNPTEYPGCVAAFGGRLLFASSLAFPQKIWASKPFEYENFTYFETIVSTYRGLKDPATWADPVKPEYETVTKSRDVTGAGSAFELELASDQSDRIEWIATGHNLVVGTVSGEWILPANLSATSIAAQLQSRYGSAGMQARLVGEAMVFLQGSGTRVREYYYSNEAGAYQSPDLVFLADHILSPGVVDFDYTNVPDPTLLFTLADGTVAALLYNQRQGAMAWYRLAFPGALVESIAVLPAPGTDEIYLEVNRSGVRSIERMERLFSGVFLDSFVEVVATLAPKTVTGLERFNGQTVTLDGGAVVASLPVADGKLTLPASIAEGLTVRIGLPFVAQMRTMRLNTQIDTGVGQGKPKRISSVTLRLLDSYPFSVGYTDAQADLEMARIGSTPFSGDVRVPFRGRWESNGWVSVVHSDPRPLTILCLVPEVDA